MKNPLSPNANIALLGAFDRFNYGDLLFPLLTRLEFERHSPRARTSAYALVASDLSQYGALPTLALRDLYRLGALLTGDTVLFAGGGTVGVDWTFMLENLLSRVPHHALRALRRLVGYERTDRLCRHYFGARAPFPWVAGPEDFPVPVNVAYNAIGGSELQRRSTATISATLERLSRATYLSVRDDETRRVFSPLESVIPVHVSPDSAVVMSAHFPIPELRRRSSAEAVALVDESPYVCFQARIGYLSERVDEIARALEQVYEEHRLPALLLPIGRYVGLDDHLALAALKKRIRTPVRMASDEASLFEIMLTIAQSQLFLGTSLHGAVTSQSFAVPHLGLSDKPGKVDHYLGTWEIPEQASCVALKDVPAKVARALGVDRQVLRNQRDDLIARVDANYARLAEACQIEWAA